MEKRTKDLDKLSVSISIVSDEQMRELNRKHAGKDYSTDVLSFEAHEPTEEGIFLLGDVVVSKDFAQKQARELGHSFEEEVAFLVAHGVMHLLGVHHEES